MGKGIYCYRKVPIGLKNAEATYQRLIEKAFDNQMGRIPEACAGYMVIKSKTDEDLLSDIKETFVQLRRINMKLNPKMCSFVVEKGQPKEKLITNRRV